MDENCYSLRAGTAQDMELVSALMSMRNSVQKRTTSSWTQPKHMHLPRRQQLEVKQPQQPSSPTRIDQDIIASAHPALRATTGILRFPPHHLYLPAVLPPVKYAKPALPVAGFQLHPAPNYHLHLAAESTKGTVTGRRDMRYTVEQRQAALRRFREKKLKRRNRANATAIRYQVRKRLADTRPRLRGRFYKPKTSEKKEEAMHHDLKSA